MWRKCGRLSRSMRLSGRRLRSFSGSCEKREFGKRCSVMWRMLGLLRKKKKSWIGCIRVLVGW